MKISAKSQFTFEQAAVATLATPGTAYTTADDWAPTLGRMALWYEKECKLRYKLKLNQATLAGIAKVKLTANGSLISETEIDLTGGQEFNELKPVDLSGVEGQSLLKMQIEVVQAADAGTEAELYGAMDIESPLILAGC